MGKLEISETKLKVIWLKENKNWSYFNMWKSPSYAPPWCQSVYVLIDLIVNEPSEYFFLKTRMLLIYTEIIELIYYDNIAMICDGHIINKWQTRRSRWCPGKSPPSDVEMAKKLNFVAAILDFWRPSWIDNGYLISL